MTNAEKISFKGEKKLSVDFVFLFIFSLWFCIKNLILISCDVSSKSCYLLVPWSYNNFLRRKNYQFKPFCQYDFQNINDWMRHIRDWYLRNFVAVYWLVFLLRDLWPMSHFFLVKKKKSGWKMWPTICYFYC